MRPKPIILLVLALGCGLVASVGINQVLAKRRAEAPVPTGETKAILVAMADIESGEVITPQLVKLEEWPIDKVPTGSMSDPTKAENRRTKTRIYAGEPLLDAKLLSEGAGSSASAVIPKGYRVVAVRVDDVSGGSSLIRPDDRVDMLVYLQENPSRGIKETTTRTILQDIRVFAVNEMYAGQGTEAPEKGVSARTISVLVTPEQAETVTLATSMGEIRLVLRSREDIGESTTTGAKATELLSGGETADREKEEAGQAGSPLLDLLQQQAAAALAQQQAQPQQAPQPTPEPAPPVEEAPKFKMVVIEGRALREVEFVDGKPTTGPAPMFFPMPPEDEEVQLEDQEQDEDLRNSPKRVPRQKLDPSKSLEEQLQEESLDDLEEPTEDTAASGAPRLVRPAALKSHTARRLPQVIFRSK